MAFRDETEALRQRVRTLQEALDGLRRERSELVEATRGLERGVEARAEELAPDMSLARIFAGVALTVVLGLGFLSGASSSSSRTYYGRVVSVSGAASVRASARCTVFVSESGSEDHDNKVSVLCDGRTIYGGGSLGYVGCTQEDDEITRCVDDSFTDDGGDPKMTFDARAGTVRIEDAAPAWMVAIKFGGALP